MVSVGRWFGPALLLLALSALLVPRLAWAGKLSSVRSEVRGNSSSSSSSRGSSSSSSPSRSSSSPSRSSSSSSSYDSYGGGSAYAGSSSCCTGSSSGIVVHRSPPPPQRRMLRRPYDRGFDGYHVSPGEDPGTAKSWAVNAGVEGAYLMDGVWRGSVNLRAAWRAIELDSRTSFLLEAPGGIAKDAMYLGDAGLWLVPLRLRHWTARLGGGLRYMVDGRTPGEGHREYALGWNVGAGVDFFPVRPLVFSGRADVGRLWQATLVQGRATVGAMVGPLEIFAGYDHLQIGAVALGGPVLGLRGWF